MVLEICVLVEYSSFSIVWFCSVSGLLDGLLLFVFLSSDSILLIVRFLGNCWFGVGGWMVCVMFSLVSFFVVVK